MSNADFEIPETVAHDSGAEQAILGVILSSPSSLLDIRRNLAWEDFYKPAHQVIYKTILKLDDEQQPIEARSVLSALTATGEIQRVPEGMSYLADLVGDAPAAAAISYYSKIVRDLATRRSLSLLATNLNQRSKTGDADPASIIERTRIALDNIAVDRLGSEIPLVKDVLPLALAEIHKLSEEGTVLGVPTGFVDLDKQLNGLQSGQMIVVAARPGVGKALSLDTEIPTPTGWTTMGRIEKGDLLIDSTGKSTKVKEVTQVLNNRPCYLLTFAEGVKVIADENHQWYVKIEEHKEPMLVTTLDLFRLRKNGTLQITSTGNRNNLKDLLEIEPTASVPVKCVEVDSPDRTYLITKAMIPTHNSSLAMDIARNAAFRQDKSVIVFSLEMSAPELVMRMLSAESHVDLQYMKTGAMTDEMWQKLAHASTIMNDSKLSLDDTATVTLPEIRAKARAIQRIHGLDLIVIDYIQLMNSDGRSDSRQQEVSEISRGIKLLAKEFKIPVIALSQLNRGSEQRQDKRPVISDLRESGCMTGDTQLLRSDNGSLVTFDELMIKGFEGVHLWSVNSERKLVSSKVTNVFASGLKETYLMRLASGKEVKASGNHKFLTFDGWKALDEMEVGERIATPRLTLEDHQVSPLDSEVLKEYTEDDIFWDKIVAIEPLGLMLVYDATVEGTHNFIANGIIAHNSIEQDADVVILLHREEMYEKESPRAGEADVIIAKQRSGPTGTIVLAWLGKFVRFADIAID